VVLAESINSARKQAIVASTTNNTNRTPVHSFIHSFITPLGQWNYAAGAGNVRRHVVWASLKPKPSLQMSHLPGPNIVHHLQFWAHAGQQNNKRFGLSSGLPQ